MDALFILVIIGIAGFGAYYIYRVYQEKQEHLASGRMINRDVNFEETEYQYSSDIVELIPLIQKLKTKDLSGTGIAWQMRRNYKQVDFSCEGSDFAASLIQKEDANKLHCYDFSFTKWKTNRGSAVGKNEMNRLMTALERSFLEIDPYTLVLEKPMKVKTHSNML